MANIGRRGFVKGATLGALAFTVGGAEVIMAAGEARARAGASNRTFTIFASSQRGAERMASQWATLTN